MSPCRLTVVLALSRMLLNGGTLDGRRYLSDAAMKFLTTPQPADLPTGFFQNGKFPAAR